MDSDSRFSILLAKALHLTSMPRFRRATMIAAVLLLGIIVQLAIYDRGVVPMDEGQLVAIAARILDGEVLYRDIHTGLFPGIYYLTALLFAVAGTDVWVTRCAALVINSVTILLLGLLALRAASARWAVLAPLLYIALIPVAFPGLTMLNYSPVALMFGLAALLFLLRYLERGGPANAVAVGAFAAAATLTKQNFGALTVLALVIALALCRRGEARNRPSLPVAFLVASAAAAAIAAVVLAPLVMNGALTHFIRATILKGFQHQVSSFYNPIPPLLGPHPVHDGRFNFLYLPSAAVSYLLGGEKPLGVPLSPVVRTLLIKLSYGAALATWITGPVILWLTRRHVAASKRRAATAIAVFAVLLFLGLFPSAIWLHLAYVTPPLFLVAVVVAARIGWLLRTDSPAASHLWHAACCLLVLCGLLVGILIARDVRRWNSEPLLMPRGSLFVQPETASLLRSAAAFVTSLTAPGDPIFVAPTMPIVYFLTGRRNPTPYDLIIPGFVEGPVIVDRLERTRPACVVYDPHMYIEFPPFEVLFPGVDRYLHKNYRAAKALRGGNQVWLGLKRKDQERRPVEDIFHRPSMDDATVRRQSQDPCGRTQHGPPSAHPEPLAGRAESSCKPVGSRFASAQLPRAEIRTGPP